VAGTGSPWSWRRSGGSAAALLTAAAAVSAASQTPVQTPQFRTRVDLVEVDVTVLDRNGRPVTTLTPGDFEVRERGALQRIETFTLVTADPAVLAAAAVPPDPAGRIQPEPPLPRLVRPLPPRVFVFVFDMNHLSPSGFTRSRDAVRGFLEDGLRPGDFAGLVANGQMLGNRLVTDKSALLAELSALGSPNLSRFNERRQWPRILSEEEAFAIARGSRTARDAAVMRACEEQPGDCDKGGRGAVEAQIDAKSLLVASEAMRDGQTTLTMLLGLANGLGRFAGPKHVVFLSEGFFSGAFAERVTQVAGLAAEHRVRISTLDARGLGTDPRQQDLFAAGPVQGTGDFVVLGADPDADVLTTLALETGGQRVRHRNNLRPALDAIAEETGTYYLVGYAPAVPFDGSYRSISVRVHKPDLTVRARRGYLASRAGEARAPVELPVAPPVAPPATPPPPGGAGPPPPAGIPPGGAPAAGPPPTGGGAAADPTALRMRPDAPLGRSADAISGRLGATSAGESRAAKLARDGWDRYSKGDVEGARELLAAAVGAGGGAWVRYALGLSELVLRNADAARREFEAVREAEPEFKTIYFDLADTYLQLGRTSDALAVLRDAAGRWPGDPETHNAVGVVLVRRGALDDAVESLSRAVAVAPGDGLGHFNLGRAHHLQHLRWLRTTPSTAATLALAERARLSALDAYRKSLAIGGWFEKDAREAIAALEIR